LLVWLWRRIEVAEKASLLHYLLRLL
jgi:hypothetical protein